MLMIDRAMTSVAATSMPHLTMVQMQEAAAAASPSPAHSVAAAAAAAVTASTNTSAKSTMPSVSRKRKLLLPTGGDDKKTRKWTEFEYEEMLEEVDLLREELQLLMIVACDLAKDLQYDSTTIASLLARMKAQEDLLNASTHAFLTMHQLRAICEVMVHSIKYLYQAHFQHFAMIEMQQVLLDCRARFMDFVVRHAEMIGLCV